jgi:hypothetical protein
MEWLLGIFLTISFHPYPGDILKPNELWFSISHEQKMSKSLSLSVSTTMTHLTDASCNTVSAPCNTPKNLSFIYSMSILLHMNENVLLYDVFTPKSHPSRHIIQYLRSMQWIAHQISVNKRINTFTDNWRVQFQPLSFILFNTFIILCNIIHSIPP